MDRAYNSPPKRWGLSLSLWEERTAWKSHRNSSWFTSETNHNQEPQSDKPENLPTNSHICFLVQKAYIILPLIRKAPCGPWQWDGGEGRPRLSVHCADGRFGIPMSDGCVVGVVDVCVGSWGRVTARSEGGVDELLMRGRFCLAGTPGFTDVQWPLCCEGLWEGGVTITLVIVVDMVTEEAPRPLQRQMCKHERSESDHPSPFTPGINIFNDVTVDFVERRDYIHHMSWSLVQVHVCMFGHCFLYLTSDFSCFLMINLIFFWSQQQKILGHNILNNISHYGYYFMVSTIVFIILLLLLNSLHLVWFLQFLDLQRFQLYLVMSTSDPDYLTQMLIPGKWSQTHTHIHWNTFHFLCSLCTYIQTAVMFLIFLNCLQMYVNITDD